MTYVYIDKIQNLWRAKNKRILTYCPEKVNFETYFGSAQFDNWHTPLQWRNFCARVDKNNMRRIMRNCHRFLSEQSAV